MSAQTISTDLMDLSPEEQEVLSGGQTTTGRILVPRARFRYGGKTYPARILVTVRGLPEIETDTDTETDTESED
ncbi:MAG: hypothetical protein MET45_14405 [Nostoc sp. LLA-1]|nr:hypothetical protein [Cyanocohniella sp. LLY]